VTGNHDWGDPGSCPDCRKPWEWVRPGKSQPVCDCAETCRVHGPHKIVYHEPGDPEPNLSGYYCVECFAREGALDARRRASDAQHR